MNIFEQDRRRSFINSFRIETQDMLDLYRLFKSIDLHIKGDFDLTKYGRLQNLKEESFLKESTDMKQTIISIYQNVVDDKWRFKFSSVCAIEFYLYGEPRAQTTRKINIDLLTVPSIRAFEDDDFVWDMEGCFRTEIEDGVTKVVNPLFEKEVLFINNYKKLISWYKLEGTLNIDFFRT